MKALAWFRYFTLGLLIPLTLCAQAGPDYPVPESTAPVEVTQALRERVNQFFQYHIGSINRRAIDLVAEDTKDFYFSSGKLQFLDVKITGVDFSKDLQRAVVKLDTTRNYQVQEFITVATTPMFTNWKIEDGKWVFFIDIQAANQYVTPMGQSAPAASKPEVQALTNPDGTLNLPKDFAEPTRVAAQGQAILSQAGLDKDSVTLTAGKAAEEKVRFHNGFTGPVSLQLSGDPHVPGLKVALDKLNLAASEDATVLFTYEPPADVAGSAVSSQHTVRLMLMPFNQEFPIRLTVLGAVGK